jgi:hypothetical protein
MPVTYIARRQLKVGDSYRQPGDPIPEAATWPNLRAYLEEGHVEAVDVETAATSPASVSAPGREASAPDAVPAAHPPEPAAAAVAPKPVAIAPKPKPTGKR